MERFLRNLFLILLCFIATFSKVASQVYVHKYLDVSDGLPQDVYRVVQDKDGYIWVCSENGIAKYNGDEFEHLTVKDGLPDNDVFNIIEDFQGRLWLLNNINQFSYIKTDSIVKIDNGLNESRYYRLLMDSSRIVFAYGHYDAITVYEDSIDMYDIEKVYYNILDPYAEKYNDFDDFMCFRNRDSLFEFTRKSTRRHTHSPMPYLKKIYQNRRIYPSDFKQAVVDDMFNMKGIRPVFYYDIVNNNYQYFKYNKLFILDSEANIIDEFKFDLNSDVVLKSAMKDLNNDYWFCSKDGVFLVDKNCVLNDVKTYPFTNNQNITDIELYNNSFLYATNDSEIYQVSNDSVVNLIFKSPIKSSEKKIYQMNIIGDSLYFSSNLEGLFNAGKEGFLVFNLINNKFLNGEDFILDSFSGSESIKSFIISADNEILFQTRFGLRSINYNSKVIESLSSDYSPVLAKRNNYIIYSKIDSLCVMKDKKVFKHLPIKYSSSIEFISDNKFLCATLEEKVFICDFNNCSEIPALNNLNIKKIKKPSEDRENTWCLYDKGLVVIGKDSLSGQWNIKKDFTLLNLLNVDVINDFEIKDSLVYLATNKGVYIYDYKNFRLEDDEIFFKLISLETTRSIFEDFNEPIEIPYSERSINIFLDYAYFKNNEPLDFYYKLSRIDKEFQKTNDKNIIYNELSPGKYELSAYAMTDNNISSSIETISFVIKKPYWQTIWFILLCFLLIGVVFYLFYRRRIEEIKKQSAIEQKFAELELNALQSQMNPHFVFNALGSVQNLVQKEDIAKADIFIAKFSRLMRMYLESSKTKYIPLFKELQIIESYFELEQLRFDNKIELVIKNELAESDMRTLIPSSLIQPFVENSINHGLFHKDGPGYIEIKLKRINKDIIINIVDDGIGRKESEKYNKKYKKGHISRAIEIIDDKLIAIQKLRNVVISYDIKDLYDENNNGKGTEVIVTINNSKNETTKDINRR